MMAVDGSVILAGGRGNNDYWAYGSDAEKIREHKDGGTDTLWYMAGPDDYILHCPPNVEKIRIATVVSRNESDGQVGKPLRIVAHPDSPIEFETSERVEIDLRGSDGDDIMIGPKHGAATFYGEAGNDTLHGGPGRDTLDGGTGDDVIFGYGGRNHIYGGHGNDVIEDGEGASTIDPGPGRNRVTLGAGDHEVLVGTGVTEIEALPGAKRFRISWGGVCVIRGWDAGQVYDLSGWPGAPQVQEIGSGVWRMRLGLGIVEVTGVAEGVDLRGQVM
jgi:Ca2+-binding RTX toxin-like protein